MRVFIAVLVLIFSFQFWSRADDIRDFQIEGMSVGDSLLNYFSEEKTSKKPKAIIANTIKGKGFSFSENNNEWHHAVLTKTLYDKAIEELKKVS